ncbi:hypothetical protein [Amycolatopsis keratiniphila]|uniref:hypothetical protein n=1 Tax=Amycolatopsis keratiniphila TaxID=129921 RepID=UPI00087C3A78|nr:hypothetical protein [Amycolatopsis keratiniphila]OLZ60696.1 hypothetical protein BS330_03445 [Amycolatopsis keratiniphila subsp. nogabecina]SDU66107.1 hypothetical protein SAMN04489733_7877 [Amycolatopsis keratiniphila]
MVRRFAIALLATICALTLAGGWTSAAAESPASPNSPTADEKEKESALVHKTAIYLHFEQHEDGSVTPAAYPAGCGLTVLISRVGNWIDNDTFTGCNFAVASIQHNLKIQCSRWYGRETLREVVFEPGFNTSNKANFLNCNCAGTGIHDFRVIGSGQVIPYGGSVATAAAYDRIDNQNCG